MKKKSNLQQSINILQQASTYSSEAAELLVDYYDLKKQGQEFLAARLVVDVVEFFEKDIQSKKEAVND
jgi:hypothetical protein